MKYNELLNECIQKKGLSHREISRRCKQAGTPVSQAYISQLVKGEVPPPSEDITKILAKVTDCDAEKLIWLGYIEKAPAEVQPIIRWYVDHWNTYAALIAIAMAITKDGYYTIDEATSEDDDKAIKEANRILNIISKAPSEERFDFVINSFNTIMSAHPDIFEGFFDINNDHKQKIYEQRTAINEMPVNRIKVFDLIKDEISYEWITPKKILYGEHFIIISPDDSMIEAKIPIGAKLLCEKVPLDHNIEEGNIYVVNLEDNTLIRRVFKNPDGLIMLQAENPKFSPQIVSNSSNFEILGIIRSVEFDIN